MPRLLARLLSLALLLSSSAPAWATERLAVLELTGKSLGTEERSILTDTVRGAVVEALAGRVQVMTKENMEVMMADMGMETSCASEGACEVETARNLGVDYVVSGSVSSMSGTLVVSVKLLETRTGQMLSSRQVKGGSALDLLDTLGEPTGSMVAMLNPAPTAAVAPRTTQTAAGPAKTALTAPTPPAATPGPFTPSPWTGPPLKPQQEVKYQAVTVPRSPYLRVVTELAVAQPYFLKVGVMITNTTADQVLALRGEAAEWLLPDGAHRVFDRGNDAIPPKATRKHVFALEQQEPGAFRVDTTVLRVTGFGVASTTGAPVHADDVPMSDQEITAGPFTCTLKLHPLGSVTNGELSCTYSGKGVGIVDAARFAARTPDGTVVPNTAIPPAPEGTPAAKHLAKGTAEEGAPRPAEPGYLVPGRPFDSKFTFAFPDGATGKQSQLTWEGVFAESALTPIQLDPWNFRADPTKSK